MELKLLILGVTIPVAANAATNVTLQNFSGASYGAPIVDNTGTPIDNSLSSWAVGTFVTDFAAGLSSLDTLTEDQNVIDAFTQSGADGSFSFNGLFNAKVSADDGNTNVGNPIYALVTYDAPDGVQALVYNLRTVFPVQDGQGCCGVDLGRILGASDIAFGNPNAVAADPSTIHPAFAGFTSGVTFDVMVPEPSTGLLSLVAGLGYLARRRR